MYSDEGGCSKQHQYRQLSMHMVQNLGSELPRSGEFTKSRISKERWDAGRVHYEHDGAPEAGSVDGLE